MSEGGTEFCCCRYGCENRTDGVGTAIDFRQTRFCYSCAPFQGKKLDNVQKKHFKKKFNPPPKNLNNFGHDVNKTSTNQKREIFDGLVKQIQESKPNLTKEQCFESVKKWYVDNSMDLPDFKSVRKGWTELEKDQIRIRQDGKCAICNKFSPRWEYDHIDNNRENNNLSNCQGLCPNCHSVKTHEG